MNGLVGWLVGGKESLVDLMSMGEVDERWVGAEGIRVLLLLSRREVKS